MCDRAVRLLDKPGDVRDGKSWDLFYHTKDCAVASDFDHNGRVVESFAVLVRPRVDEDVIAGADIFQVAAFLENIEAVRGIGRGDVSLAMNKEIRRAEHIDLFDGLLVTSEPVVGLVDAERAPGPADEGVVVSVFKGMEVRGRHDIDDEDDANNSYVQPGCCLRSDSFEPIQDGLKAESCCDEDRREDKKKMAEAVVHGRAEGDNVEGGDEEGGEGEPIVGW